MDYEQADEVTKTALKVIADHTRAVVYLVSDRVNPSNIGRGYIVRRLLRRVVLKGRLLGIKEPFIQTVAQVAIDMSGDCDPQVLPPETLRLALCTLIDWQTPVPSESARSWQQRTRQRGGVRGRHAGEPEQLCGFHICRTCVRV